MITIFCEFCQFSAEKIGVFLRKPMLWSKFFNNLALFWVKNANFFADFFGENILKNHNIGPRMTEFSPIVQLLFIWAIVLKNTTVPKKFALFRRYN
jgi:hypothetical protein